MATTAQRLTALEARCTAIETKNRTQDAALAALTTRVTRLEADVATLWRIYNENQGTRKNVVPGTSRAVAWAQAPSLLKLASPSYFVATTGSDANPGTLASPFLTLSKGVSVLNPGDTLYIRGGTYLLSSQLNISRSGTAAQRITIDAYPGESVVISGDVNGDGVCQVTDTPGSQWSYLLRLSGSYSTLQNVAVCFSGGRGVETRGSYNTVSGCTVHDCFDMGIMVSGSYSTVESNTVYANSCCYKRPNPPTSNYSAGIGVGNMQATAAPGGAPYATIRDNQVYRNWGEGILVMHTDYPTVEGNVVWDNYSENILNDRCSYCTIQNNLVYWTGDLTYARTWNVSRIGIIGIQTSNEASSPAINPDPYPIAHHVKILNNIVLGSSVGGIVHSEYEAIPGNSDYPRLIDSVIAGNTSVETSGTCMSIGAGLGAANSGNRICDNICISSTGTTGSASSATGLTFDHNCWSKAPQATCVGSGDVVSDPLLVDATHALTAGAVSADWYKLTASSPARSAGVAHADLTEDYWETARSDPPDMGAHEY